MILQVSLAGATLAWRFRDSYALDAWLGERPWIDHGCAKVVRISAPAFAPNISQAIRRSIRAHDDGLSEVRVHVLGADECGGGIRSAVARILDMVPGLTQREYLRQVAEAVSSRPTVFLVHPPDPVAAPRLCDEAQLLVEHISKTPPNPAATVILLDTPAAPTATPDYDLMVGNPIEGLLATTGPVEATLWRAYVHQRLAWESGGELARATGWSERGFTVLRVGDDNALEKMLNNAAAADFNQVEASTRLALRAYLDDLIIHRKDAVQFQALTVGLVRDGLLWRPVDEVQLRPVPWVARALLLTRAAEGARFLLRGCLVCAPLAREILGRCFDMEARERTVLWSARGTAGLPPEIADRYHRFCMGRSHSEVAYPIDCPAAPTDGWHFATFGEFLSVLRLDRARRPHHHGIREVRNAIAHGHYVCWDLIKRLLDSERQLHR